MQIITGDKQTEIIKLESLLKANPVLLFNYFLIGSKKGRATVLNDHHQNQNIEIQILGKTIHNNELELLFDKGTNDGVKQDTILSIVPKHFDQLWGVISIIEAEQETSKGIVVSPINKPFWQQLINEAETDVSPPVDISARLYKEKDLLFEIQSMKDKTRSENQRQ